jgi:putative oxidoreductase
MKKLLSTRYSETGFSIAVFLLRIVSGGLMIPHGYDKLKNFSTYASGFTDPFHLGGSLSLSLSIFAEFFCAILLVFGLLTRLATLPLIVNMAVAIIVVHKGDLLFYIENGHIYGTAEQATLYMGIFMALLFTGAGKFSLDKMIGK